MTVHMATDRYYDVTYRLGGRGPRIARVQIIEGYTSEKDIPKIIATRETGQPEDSILVAIERVKEVAQ